MSERILCVGGPYNGIYHEVKEGWPAPQRMGLTHPTDETDPNCYWYNVTDGVADFDPDGERD